MSATRSGSPRTPTARGPGGEAKTAFVLSGGGSLGALQVGMLHALYERGIFPDLLVATSVGALNAAFIAPRPQTVATAGELRRVWRNLRREDIFPVSMSALIGGFCGRRDRLAPNRGLRQLVRRQIAFEELADAVIPLHLVAFDLIEGREVLLSEGPAVETIVAAASIPGVFPPVEIADRRLIDGSVVNNTPISHAVELGADKIFVLPTRELGPSSRDRQRLRSTRPSTVSACWTTAVFKATSRGTHERSTSSSSRVRTAPGCNRPTSSTPTVWSSKRSSPPEPSSRGTGPQGTCNSSHSDRTMLLIAVATGGCAAPARAGVSADRSLLLLADGGTQSCQETLNSY